MEEKENQKKVLKEKKIKKNEKIKIEKKEKNIIIIIIYK